ncbi:MULTISPECIES: transglutaminase family protein [unclassified Synechococcus]|uniref:transglutaminase family protein n=1 Tax=unclassified Synechococcus TaxID=2626047 RepID=UPI001E48D157|nr:MULTISPECIES: transglutaminase family protein [unclassified Synechococcus]WFN59463.1 transglutaminase family protein [Synechococcus sp. CCFWC 502]
MVVTESIRHASADAGWMAVTAAEAERRLSAKGIQLTLGGEPTVVPVEPEGAEWSVAADGPTKLRYARRLAAELQRRVWPGSTLMYCPGKRYDGEVNPRWALRLITGLDGTPLVPWPQQAPASSPADQAAPLPLPAKRAEDFLHGIGKALGHEVHPLRLKDPLDPSSKIWAVPLSHSTPTEEEPDLPEGWQAARWPLAKPLRELLPASGPAGLRLPLQHFPEGVLRQVLTLEVSRNGWNLFLPPLPRQPLEQLLHLIAEASAGWSQPELSGVLPSDLDGCWNVLGLTADPGVLEVNLPVCHGWADYNFWIRTLSEASEAVGLRSWKQLGERQEGTGGGNHLLWGGPSLETNPFFSRPAWLVAILRFWQRHPSLSYLFGNSSVGPASQAPRLDEGSASSLDLLLAHRAIESLPEGDQRILISETLRHLHADRSGNTHRSEISFDKFWNPAWAAGCQGLIEFRAIETLPDPDWTAAIALLWSALAAHLLDPAHRPSRLEPFGERLHDAMQLPQAIWSDLQAVLDLLARDGLVLEPEPFRAIWEWRFPLLLNWEQEGARLEIRRALEPWPLLCDTPVQGGNTSRFVDSSLQRLELKANTAFLQSCSLRLNGRELPLGDGWLGLRYRHSRLYPSLHPCVDPHLPLRLEISGLASAPARFELGAEGSERITFEPIAVPQAGDSAAEGDGPEPNHDWSPQAPPWPAPSAGLRTLDLRLG